MIQNYYARQVRCCAVTGRKAEKNEWRWHGHKTRTTALTIRTSNSNSGSDKSPVHHRAVRDKQPFMLTFTPTGNLESEVNLHVFGLWEETHTHTGDHANSTHKGSTPARYRTHDLSYSEATVLTNKHLCWSTAFTKFPQHEQKHKITWKVLTGLLSADTLNTENASVRC